ncbi:P-loop containing nucleoside triphosphate hydrolase protein [Zopfochytrium polystomum]|nr:P-loop containing nucleoside triphosphate hydrolase protein [Zopfochytrium polystomum]
MQNRGGVDGSSPTPHTLRPYQEECIAASLKAFEEGVKRQAVSLPVGSGKTVIFSNLIPRIPVKVEGATRTLVLAHRGELLEQAKTQIQNNAPLVVMKDQGSKKLEADDLKDADVVVASVQTLGRANTSRFDLYKPELFKCIIIGRFNLAHHAASASYQRVLEKFGALKPESHILVWGCSATLRREDGRSLGVAFEKIVYHKPFIEMIREKHLSNLRVGTVKTDILVDGIRVTAGDYDTAQLSMAVNVDRRNICVVEAWKQYAHEHPTHKRKMTVAFAVDVAHIESLTQAFRDAGIDARGVNGNMSTAERNDTIEDFRKGLFPVIVNCGILTEGVDIPGIDCVLLARPTRSSVLLQQMIGRGLRKYKCPNGVEKADCLVLDFVDVTRREAGMRMTVPSLLGLRSDFEMKPGRIFLRDSIWDDVFEQCYSDEGGCTTWWQRGQ